MTEPSSTLATTTACVPWNKGKIVGANPPLRPKHVWSIRTMLQVEGRIRDLALFNLAIDSKLRGCDVVALKVDDIAPSGYATDRATVRQTKTGRPVRFELMEGTRQAVDDYLKATGKNQASTCSSADVGRAEALRPDSTLACSENEAPASGWTRTCLERIRSDGLRRR